MEINTWLAFYVKMLFVFLAFPYAVFAQITGTIPKDINPIARQKFIKLPNADAKNAIEIQDSIAGPFNVSVGYGLLMEAKSTKICEWCNEDNSAWFKFTMSYDTVLTFDIVPIDGKDYYNFVLFKCHDINCIDKDGNGNFEKIRYRWQWGDHGINCTMGLLRNAESTGVNMRPGVTNYDGVQVKAGETYYLMIDYNKEDLRKNWDKWHSPSGFMIYFYDYNPKRKPIVLNNIFFETGKAVLQKESFPELDKLVLTLSKNQMVIEVRGHTDNEGDEKKNKQLSEDRAKAVVDYLVSKKINRNRLSYKGFGSSMPRVPNSTKEGRQKNRRVEFVKVMY